VVKNFAPFTEPSPEDYVCEVASTVEEAKKLVKAGFDRNS